MEVQRFNTVMIASSRRGISHYHLTDFNLLSLSLLSTRAIDLSVCPLVCVLIAEFLQPSSSGSSRLLSYQQIFTQPCHKVSFYSATPLFVFPIKILCLRIFVTDMHKHTLIYTVFSCLPMIVISYQVHNPQPLPFQRKFLRGDI